MSEKRRDGRKRILHNGEMQLADGRYRFKYLDHTGQVRYVYSWRLDKNDRTPDGRKNDIPLREKERKIQADLFDQIVSNGGNYTVLELVERYVSTKTESGKRMVPMTPEVEACFRRILEARAKPKIEPIIDGHSGFLFLDKNGMPMVALHWEKYFQHIVEKYNKIYKVQLPKITPHVCRHTFCSKMAKNGMNPKTLQYIMGHSDISVTLNTYTHVSFEDAQAEVKRMSAD